MSKKRKKQQTTIQQGLMSLFAAAAAGMALIRAVVSVTGFYFFVPVIMLGTVIGMAAWLPYVLTRRKKLCILFGVAPFAVISVLLRGKLWNILADGIVLPIFESMDTYFRNNMYPAKKVSAFGTVEMTFGILFLCLAILCLLMILWGYRGQKVTGILLVGCICALPFLTGNTLDGAGALAAGLSVLFLVMPDRKRAGWYVIVTAAAAVFAGMFFPRIVLDQIFQTPVPIWEYAESFVYGDTAAGGVSDGRLGDVEEVRESGRDQLEIVLSEFPEQTLYLRGYVGVVYEDNEWKRTRDTGGLGENELARQREREFTRASDNAGYYGWQTMKTEIRRLGANSRYAYIPYISRGDQSYYYDLYAEGNASDYEADTVLVQEVTDLEYFPSFEDTGEDQEYLEAIRDLYTEVPKETEQLFDDMAGSVYETGIVSMAGNIRDQLGNMAIYTKSPGRTPRGEDFLTWFVENQKGYCVHFASAGVMLFRINDVPARFVSGYVARPEQFEETEDGTYKAVLDDSMAHAWPEIYVDGLGWMPVEVTPSAGIPAGISQENGQAETPQEPDTPSPQDTPEQPSEVPQTDPAATSEDDPGQNTENPGSGISVREKRNLYASCGIGILLVGVGAAAVLLRERRWRKLRKNRDKQGHYLDIYRFLFDLLSWKQKGKELSEDVQETAEILEKIYGIPREESEVVLEKAYEIVFGNGKANRQQQRNLWKICENVRKQIQRNLSFSEKISFLYRKGF
nr:transglutaminase domain-containing protein [uncultured Sellimonas sp.]